MKIKLDKEIGNLFPQLKYILLPFGCLKGLALLGWLVYCIANSSPVFAGTEDPAIFGGFAFLFGCLVMFISLFLFYEDNCDVKFRDLISRVVRTYFWFAGPVLVTALMFKYMGLWGGLLVIILAAAVLLGKLLQNLFGNQ